MGGYAGFAGFPHVARGVMHVAPLRGWGCGILSGLRHHCRVKAPQPRSGCMSIAPDTDVSGATGLDGRRNPGTGLKGMIHRGGECEGIRVLVYLDSLKVQSKQISII